MNEPLVHIKLPLGIPLKDVLEAERNFLDAISEVARSLVPNDSVSWVLESVTGGSVQLNVRGKPAQPENTERVAEAAEAFTKGVEDMQSDRQYRPSFFTDKALTAIGRLADIPGVEIGNPTRSIAVTPELGGNLLATLRPDVLVLDEIGTVEGTLEKVDAHDQRTFSIYDRLTNDRIECHFGERISVDQIGDAILRRVAVHGSIRYKRNGRIERVLAQELEIFPDADTLPSASDVLGMLSD